MSPASPAGSGVGGVVRLELRHPAGRTPILVGAGVLESAGAELGEWWRDRLLFVVTSERVAELHGDLLSGLDPPPGRLVMLEVEDGEGAKSPTEAERLWRRMLRAGGKRDSRLLAFGGGSVGDLGGFVAGTFLRGIPVVQVPTTLLAQVDAAVGGKTAVDLPEAKNSVGLFYHPHMVVADTRLLQTLPREELRSGLVEVIKMAALLDPALLDLVEESRDRLLVGDPEALVPVVAGAVQAKVTVVESDPDEQDRRRLLNFGHTLGHAIEAVAGYGTLRHGEAVAYGILFALRLALRRGLDPSVARRLASLLLALDLPALPPLERDRLLEAMGRDKKATEGGLVWVLPAKLGEGSMVSDVGGDELSSELERFLQEPLAEPG